MLYVNDSAIWKESTPYVKDAGLWKPAKQVYTRSSGVWKEVMLLNLYQQLDKLGLTSNLRLCLDAGAAASLPTGSTKWLDLSGGGYDFFRGVTVGAEGSDPTINGTANARSSAEFLSFDGGDYLTYDSANEGWMNNFHKAGAQWTVATWIWYAASTSAGFIGTNGNSVSPGFAVGMNGSGKLATIVHNNSTQIINNATAASIPTGGWCFLANSFDSSGGATGNILAINGAYETATATLNSPSASNAAVTMQIGSRANGTVPLPNGSRMAGFMIWEGRALNQAELTAVFNATRVRFGV
ncbi:LamG domain-containing protein [Mesorhizobium sp. CA14]|uniref:LamG domain-containing protein n=1 Tax=Mesorhizobium sp. CA14 TaxID=2876642 RepID=UPI001CCC799E|nr:LamG domain-containing protein [Mesorhizobium sp. CA14]MBZ9850122.1 LamG domain-containing protein [Mesorhizobium sp. CA14]